MRTLLQLAAVILVIASAADATSAPTVEVRARTEVQLDPIIRTRYGIRLAGIITDRASPEPIADAAVVINVGDEIHTTLSDDRGRFELEVYAEEGLYDIQVSFPGSRFLDPSDITFDKFDVSNKPLELSLSAQKADAGQWELVVRAQSAGRAADVSVVLWGGDVTAAELGRLAELTTDNRGRASQLFSREALGGFGDKRIEVRFNGDDTYDAATASTTFSIGATTSITFELDDNEPAFEDKVKGNGIATDQLGQPLAGQRVVMEAAGKEFSETTTDKRGAFVLAIEASELGEGKTAVQAVLDPNTQWLASSRSEPVTVSIAKKKPVPIAATLAAFGATCAALLAFVVLRTKPWTKWLERLSHREPETSAASSKRNQGRRPPGLSPARPSLVSTLRRPSDFGFSGQVFDVVTSRAIKGALVRVLTSGEKPPPEHQTKVNSDGAFVFEALPAGSWRVEVTAPSYMPESFDIVVPHKGELRNAHVELLSVREHIFDLYGELARPLLPNDDRWGVWTPRQIFEHVRARRRSSSLRSLTDSVEELYFSQRSPNVDAVAVAEAEIARVRTELGPRT